MNSNQLRKNLIYNTVGNAFYYVSQWLVTAWLVTGVPLGLQLADGGVENAGLLATAATLCNIFINLAGFGMRTYQVSDTAGEYTDSDYANSRWFTATVASVLCMGWAIFVGYGDKQLLAVLLFMVFKMMEPLTDVWHGMLQKAGRMDTIGIAYILRGVISAGTFALALKLSSSLMLALFAMMAATVVLCVLYDRRKAMAISVKSGIELDRIGQLLVKCLPLAAYAFLNPASANLPKIYLERLQGVDMAGLYSLVNSPVLILQVGVTYLFSPFITLFAQKLQQKDRQGFLRMTLTVTGVVFAAGVLGAFGCSLFGKWGLNLLYANDAVTGLSILLYPMVVGVVFNCLSIFWCMLLTVLREMRGLIWANVAGIVTAALISGPLIRRYALAGTSYASILAMMVQCVCLGVFGWRALKQQTEDKQE